jgi:hypothetical protein
VSTLPVSFTEYGLPLQFRNDYASADTVLGGSFLGPTDGRTAIVQGIDASAGAVGVGSSLQYNLNGVGPVRVSAKTWDPTSDDVWMTHTWRGAIPVGNGDTIEFLVDSTGLCSLTLVAWGIIVPVPKG